MTETQAIPLAVVRFINTKPLAYGLDQHPDLFKLQFHVPSQCAALLHGRSVDLAMLSAIEYLRQPDYRAVPGVAVASKGPVRSVALYTTRRIEDIRSIALDSRSRTSATLLRILCQRRYAIEPEFVTMRPNLSAMLNRCDGALMIGDAALFAQPGPEVQKIDLGEEWTNMTGLPFVWSFWVGRPQTVRPAHVQALRSARVAGTSSLDTIVATHRFRNAAQAAIARSYLHENLRFELTEEGRAAVERFYAAAADIGVVPDAAPLRFFDT